MQTVNPATGQPIKDYQPLTHEQAEHVLIELKKEGEAWKQKPVKERASAIKKAGELLLERSEENSRLISQEMGKPVGQAKKEIESCAETCEYIAENAEQFLEPEPIVGVSDAYVCFEPLGTILGIMPWNFPFGQVCNFAIPSLAAGNAIAVKHATIVTGSNLACQSIFQDAGLPFTALVVTADTALQLISSPHIQGVAFTGSTETGKIIAAAAGRALKPMVLEMGGNDPFVVLDDADLEKAAENIVSRRFWNCGQACTSPKRVIVTEKNKEQFLQLVQEKVKAIRFGDPMGDVDMGPLSSREQQERVTAQVQDAKEKGATILAGGHPQRPGNFFEPTILTDVTHEMRVLKEELFGPVITVITVPDETAALAEANNTQYGLAGSVWTQSPEKGRLFAESIQAGSIGINRPNGGHPGIPFGGIKHSGIGRERGKEGVRAFVNKKAIRVA